MYYAGDDDACQHKCDEIGKYIENCSNVTLSNNLKNYHKMYLCKMHIVSEVYLSQLNSSHPLKIKILNTYLPSNILMIHTSQINRLNLIQQVRNNIILNRRVDHRTTKSIKAKMLASYNSANEEAL